MTALQPHLRYLVTIHYKEPTYQKRAPSNRARRYPYTACYEVTTSTADRARALALNEFRETARNSSVGWIREVDRVECTLLGDDVVCRKMGEP